VLGGVSSAVRLELPVNGSCGKRVPFVLSPLHGGMASIRDSVNADLHEVAVAVRS
jgi:hypothetical protein